MERRPVKYVPMTHCRACLGKGRRMTHAQHSGNATLVDRIQGKNSQSLRALVPHAGRGLADFLKLEDHARRSAPRTRAQYVSKSVDTAARELHDLQKQQSSKEEIDRQLAEQLVMLAELKPRKFRTRMQRLAYEGPEADLRSKYLRILADILKNTETPMGQLLREDPKNIHLLGAGRRASTLWSRVRGVQKFLGWLAAAHNLAFPDCWRHYSEFLQVRLAEPCVRGALKHTHSCYVFLQEVAGVSVRHTDNAFYTVNRKEILTSALPGRPPRQAPRYPSGLLAAFEELVMDPEAKQYLRIMGWWLLLQAWGTLRFDDHRGLLPADVGGGPKRDDGKVVSHESNRSGQKCGLQNGGGGRRSISAAQGVDADRLERSFPGSAVRERLHASHADEQSQRMQMRRASVPHRLCNPIASHCALNVRWAENLHVGDAALFHSPQRS